jgi:hypothetical protein
MRAQRFTRYGVLGGLLAGLACAGNSARTDDTTVARDTTTAQNPSGYSAMSRDTSLSGVSDSVKSGQTKSGATEVKPGESMVGTDSTQWQSQPVTAKGDTLRAGSDTTAQ